MTLPLVPTNVVKSEGVFVVRPVRQVADEVLFTESTGSSPYTGNLGLTPITPGSISITRGSTTLVDDGAGAITGTGVGVSTINYATGAYSIALTTEVDDQVVTAAYSSVEHPIARYDMSQAANYPVLDSGDREITFYVSNLSGEDIVVKAQKSVDVAGVDTINDNGYPNYNFEKSFEDEGAAVTIKPKCTHKMIVPVTRKFMQLVSVGSSGSVRVQGVFFCETMELSYNQTDSYES